jgi:hypothetical protein
MDFTLSAYDRIIAEAVKADYRLLTIREALAGADSPLSFIVRHDVEWRLSRTLAVTEIEKKHGVRSSLYFRVDTGVLKSAIITTRLTVAAAISKRHPHCLRPNYRRSGRRAFGLPQPSLTVIPESGKPATGAMATSVREYPTCSDATICWMSRPVWPRIFPCMSILPISAFAGAAVAVRRM